MVTKAVSDQLNPGHGGIADQMIRFNGLPCLEKDDQAYGVAVGQVMTGRRHGVRVLGEEGRTSPTGAADGPVYALPPRIPLRVLERECFAASAKGRKLQGWPVVKGADDLRVVGYVGTYRLERALGKPSRRSVRFTADMRARQPRPGDDPSSRRLQTCFWFPRTSTTPRRLPKASTCPLPSTRHRSRSAHNSRSRSS